MENKINNVTEMKNIYDALSNMYDNILLKGVELSDVHFYPIINSISTNDLLFLKRGIKYYNLSSNIDKNTYFYNLIDSCIQNRLGKGLSRD